MSYRNLSSSLDDAEKPFWISYSDLMTALMILFLVVMVTSLASISQQAIKIKENMELIKKSSKAVKSEEITKKINKNIEINKKAFISQEKLNDIRRLEEIKKTCELLKASFIKKDIPVVLDCIKNTIRLGEAGRFNVGSYTLTDSTKSTLTEMVQQVLLIAKSDLGRKWLKRIHVSGYTDYDGGYLYNLNLSLKRSEWVICQIVNPVNIDYQMSDQDRLLVKRLFMVSGVSYNDQLQSKEASRRVEFKLEFRDSIDTDSKGNDEYEVDLKSESLANDTCPI